jgi:hypothetical protein
MVAWARFCVVTLIEKHRFPDWVPSLTRSRVKKFVIEAPFSDFGTAKPSDGAFSGIAPQRFSARQSCSATAR